MSVINLAAVVKSWGVLTMSKCLGLIYNYEKS